MLSTGNNNKKDVSSFVLLSRFGSGNYIYYRYLDIEKWTNQTAFIDGRNVVVQSLRHVQLFVTPRIAAQQSSLSLNISWSLIKLMSIESIMPSDHLILCCPVLLLPSIFPSIRVFSNEMDLGIRWPRYWRFSISISPSNEYSGLISIRTDWSPCSPRDSQESSPTPQFKSINSSALSLLYGPTLTSIHD